MNDAMLKLLIIFGRVIGEKEIMEKKRVLQYKYLVVSLIFLFFFVGCADITHEAVAGGGTEVYVTLNGKEILLGEINIINVPKLKDTEMFIVDDKEYKGKRYTSLDEAKDELELDFWERSSGYEWSDIILHMTQDGEGVLQLLYTEEKARTLQEQKEVEATMRFMRFATGEVERINMTTLTDTENISDLSGEIQTETFQVEEPYYCDNFQAEVTFIKSAIKCQVAFEGKKEIISESYYVFWIEDDIAYQMHFIGDRSAIIRWLEDVGV